MVNPAVQPTDRTIVSMMLLHLKPLKRLFTWTNLKTAAMLENINALWRSNIPVGISHTQKKRLNMAFQNTNCQNTHINNKKKGCNVSPTQKGANSQNCSRSFRLDQRCFSQTTRECGESGKGPPFFFSLLVLKWRRSGMHKCFCVFENVGLEDIQTCYTLGFTGEQTQAQD